MSVWAVCGISTSTLPPLTQSHTSGHPGTGVQPARSAGMFAVGVLWGFRPRAELEESGARVLVSRPEELLAYL